MGIHSASQSSKIVPYGVSKGESPILFVAAGLARTCSLSIFMETLP